MKKQTFTPFNHKNQKHGYWIYYFSNGNIAYKGNFINGKQSGYWKLYYDNGNLARKLYYIL